MISEEDANLEISVGSFMADGFENLPITLCMLAEPRGLGDTDTALTWVKDSSEPGDCVRSMRQSVSLES